MFLFLRHISILTSPKLAYNVVMEKENKSTVHSTHCCKKHGCKYCDDNCPVVLGLEPQEYRQECCDEAEEVLMGQLSGIYHYMREKNITSITAWEIQDLIDIYNDRRPNLGIDIYHEEDYDFSVQLDEETEHK
jgi:hypothetical protein